MKSRYVRKPFVNTEERKAWRKNYYENDKDAVRNQSLKSAYGITLDDYNAMVEAQDGLCAICGKPAGTESKGRLHVDHCHSTKKVRALLCFHCNRGLGSFFDDPTLLKRGAEYILRFKGAACLRSAQKE